MVFNNAGMGTPAMPLEDLTVEQWKTVVDVDLTGAFLCTQEAFRQFKAQDPQGDALSTTARFQRTCRVHSPPLTRQPNMPSRG